MAVELTGGCNKCGRLISVGWDYTTGEPEPTLICSSCYEKHYSPSAIREKRFKKLLDKKWYEFWK